MVTTAKFSSSLGPTISRQRSEPEFIDLLVPLCIVLFVVALVAVVGVMLLYR